MSGAMHVRGPDGEGVWAEAGVGLGHRRLSILDLSQAGAQPMVSASGRYRISYNGEVYNFIELREELRAKGHTFNGGSDTEVVLAAFEEWGVEQSLPRFLGMFAIAVWDGGERRLTLVRDRLGIKPLYYGHVGRDFVFASELKALHRHPEFRPEIDSGALALYLRHNYVPEPQCIFRGLRKLEPGHLVTVSLDDVARGTGESTPRPWWDAGEIWRRAVGNPFQGTYTEAVDELERLLSDAVRLRMIADVPVGALLSGGIDSSLLAALMTRAASGPVRTFTVGFSEESFNEAGHARAVAAHLGCEHTEMTVGPSDLLALIPALPEIWDEPFGDASQVPTHLVYRLLKGRVTVVLSGDGGDELFCGYSRYFWADVWRKAERLPLFLRQTAAGVCSAVPGICRGMAGPTGRKLLWRMGMLRSRTFAEFYQNLVSHHLRPTELMNGGTEPRTALTDPANQLPGADRRRQMMFWDLRSYLPGDILTKADRASMGASVEARVPLLDHRVAEFSASLPSDFLVRGSEGKQPLRTLLHRYVPRELVDRPKQGFGVPIEDWLARDLRSWAEDLLSPGALKASGLFNVERVRGLWRAHLGGDSSRYSLLWNVLMFQAWRTAWA